MGEEWVVTVRISIWSEEKYKKVPNTDSQRIQVSWEINILGVPIEDKISKGRTEKVTHPVRVTGIKRKLSNLD